MSGKFIVIEGSDSSGKKTQATLLSERLKKTKNVEMISFPTYQKTKLGAFVSKYLKGEFGSKEEINPEVGSLLYAIDRFQFKETLMKKLKEGKMIIADRYTTSNIYQAAKVEGDERFRVWEWIKKMESRIPQPDVVVYLNVPPEFSVNLFGERDVKNKLLEQGEKDIHENDVEYLKRVRELYLEIAKREKNWIVIDCIKDGNFRSKQDIADEVFEKLKKFID